MQITEDRKKQVINLYFNQHKSYAEIVQLERISPRDIHAIIKEEKDRRQKYKDQQRQEEISSKAYDLFSEGKTPVQVAITLKLGQPEVTKLYREYWKLKRLDRLYSAYTELGDEGLGAFLKLYRLMKKKGMSIEQVVNVVEIAANKLSYMENLYIQAKDQAERMQSTVQRLANDIEERKNKILLLDKTAFSIELDFQRKQQQLQELIAQKDRMEKWIEKILNGEGLSKLNQIVKENVRAVLSDNKLLISASFAVIIQTLKDDPEMANLIYNVPGANDDEQFKDSPNDNNIITKYLEFNKDKILDLAEENYENFVEIFDK